MSLVVTDTPAAGIARISINRPERRNAFNPEVREALIGAYDAAITDEQVRAIVMGSAHGVFCAGGDITGMTESTPEAVRARMKRNHQFVRAMIECRKPVVASVEGFAVGAGCGLALMADTIVLGEGAVMGIPFFKLGLVPDYAIFHLLPRRMGQAQARQVLLYGRNYKGREALEIGLCDVVAPDAQVADKAVELAQELASQPRNAFALTKMQLALYPQSLDAALEMENMAQSLSFHTADHAEGKAAFLQKRKPKFA
jgi:enoyl-CoA hydratase/carnithine racemase